MNGDAAHVEARQVGSLGKGGARLGPRNTELVLLAPGRDFLVGTGINVRVDPDGDVDGRVARSGDFAECVKFGFRFDVELENPSIKCKRHLCPCLADPREHDLVGGDACGAHLANLALGNDVGAGPFVSQRANNGKVVVGLYRKKNPCIEACQGIGKDAVVTL